MKGWKTIIFAVLLAVLGTLQQFDFVGIVPPGYEGLALQIIGAAVLVLRMLTNTPVAKKE